MNKVEYLSRLDDCLKSLADPERREALEFYYSYFEDGLENGKTEQQIIEELGSPQEAAEKIFAETGAQREENPAKGAGYGPYGAAEGARGHAAGGYDTYGGAGAAGAAYAARRPQEDGDRVWKIVLIVLACIFLGPPAAGVALGILGAAFGILVALAVVLVVVPVSLIAAAFICLAAVGGIGVSAVGWFLVLLGIGVLAATLSCLIVWQLVRLFRFLSRRIGEEIRMHRQQKTERGGERK